MKRYAVVSTRRDKRIDRTSGEQHQRWCRACVWAATMVCFVARRTVRALSWKPTTRSVIRPPTGWWQANGRTQDVVGNGALSALPKRWSASSAREDFYSIADAFDDDNQRPYPPTMNSQDEEDGFGAYEYDMTTLDPYDQAELEREQRASGTQDGAWQQNADPKGPRVFGTKNVSLEQSNVDRPPTVPPTRNQSVPKTTPLPMAVSISSQPLEYTPIVEESVSIEELTASIKSDRVGQASTNTPDPSIAKAYNGYGAHKNKSRDEMEGELAALEVSIYEQNNGKEFNLNSPKQVGMILFGTTGGSTNKDVLEAMAGGGNRMADLILQHRALKYQIGKMVRRQESVAKGTAVQSASTVARAQTNTEGAESDDVTLSDVTADPLLLLDASAYIFRAYYSMPPIHRSDGMPTGAVMGFCKMLNSMLLERMLQGEQPRLVLCFDAKGKTFRHELYGAYKGNRPSAPMDLVPQFELVRQAAKAYGICQIEALSFEADDVIATLATMAVEEGVDANILSGDKDLMQLVTDLDATPSIQMIDPVKKDRTTYKQVVEKWEVPPNKLGDVLALSGDTADNIPGVKGIGPKNAAKLINEFDTLDNLLRNIDSVKQQGLRDKLNEHKGNARLSRVLVELNRTVPLEMITGLPNGVDQRIGDLRMEPFDAERILSFYDQMGFKELKRTFEFRLKGVKAKRKTSSYARTQTTVPRPQDYSDVPF